MRYRIRRISATAIAMAAWSSPSYPAPDGITAVRMREITQMVAASPERERYREWLACVGPSGKLMLDQGKSRNQIEAMTSWGCADEESRLTGALVKKFGYARGTAAMHDMKREFSSTVARMADQRDNPVRDPNVFEKTEAGWETVRVGANSCISIIIPPNTGYGQFLTSVWKAPTATTLTFGDVSDLGRIDGQAHPKGQRVQISAQVYAKYVSSEITLTVDPVGFDRGIDFKILADENLISSLSRYDKIIFRFGKSASPFGSPRSFPLLGLAEAWQSVLRCVR